MSESKRRIYMSLVAFAIAIWAFNNLQGKDKVIATTPQLAPAVVQVAATGAVITPDLTIVKNKPWGADPFYRRASQTTSKRATRTKSAVPNLYKLKAIIYNETSPSAFLNGRVVRPGDMIDGATIIKITKRAVTLKESGREIIVTVKRG